MLSLSDLRLSLENLHDQFGSTGSPLFGLVINLGLAAIGAIAFLAINGPLEILGLAWAIINLLGIAKWVIGG